MGKKTWWGGLEPESNKPSIADRIAVAIIVLIILVIIGSCGSIIPIL